MDTLTNTQKALELAHLNKVPDEEDRYYCTRQCELFDAVLEACEMKDKEMWNTINLILDSIDHAYLEINGGYGDLSIEVVDKVNYLKKLRSKRK